MEHFLIFDFCENFEFFGEKPLGIDTRQDMSLTQHLFNQRLKLIFLLQKRPDPDSQNLAEELRHYLHQQVEQLNEESFLVRQHWRVVEKYRDRHRFNALNELEVKELADHIAPLVFGPDDDELAKRFDQLCYTMELDLLRSGSVAAHLVQNQPLGKFVRSIVGLDLASARAVFSAFINKPAMNAQQIRFMDLFIQDLTTNGVIEVDKLFEPPFTEISTEGLLGVFSLDEAMELESLIGEVNRFAEVG